MIQKSPVKDERSPIITGDEGGGAALLSLLRSPLLSKKDYEVDYKKEAESTSDTPTDNEKAKNSIRDIFVFVVLSICLLLRSTHPSKYPKSLFTLWHCGRTTLTV
uniref:Uncharacterized protein n=1 Tax=Oryza sativa subsp. japonica TaxID=39947 RepID=Q33AW2_ORYSJ|nr:hypothetical protein LOC_Os10g07350 [Oryza sativa Japonica Group]